MIGNPSTDARTNYVFIGDQLNGTDERDEFHLRLLESVNNLKNSDANEVFNDYFNVLVLEEANHTGASIFNIIQVVTHPGMHEFIVLVKWTGQ